MHFLTFFYMCDRKECKRDCAYSCGVRLLTAFFFFTFSLFVSSFLFLLGAKKDGDAFFYSFVLRGNFKITQSSLLVGLCLLTSARLSFHPWPVSFCWLLFCFELFKASSCANGGASRGPLCVGGGPPPTRAGFE